MTENINIQLVTPLNILTSKDVSMAVLPGSEGDLGIMYRHTPMMTLLNRGFVKLFEGNQIVENIVIDGGVLEVNETGIIVLSERAEIIKNSNKQIIQEKLINSEKLAKNNDQSISSIANDESDFYRFVLNAFN
jgi:F-type H+-transporting ATPase subunit epsilon|tara:strand:+ start:1915 stop:2313 length:399 start_codon:yes stop_codon:yes gene_type:complete